MSARKRAKISAPPVLIVLGKDAYWGQIMMEIKFGLFVSNATEKEKLNNFH